MSEKLGNRGSPGNIMKALGKIISLLEEQNTLLRQLSSKSNNTVNYYNEDPVVEKANYANKTGQRKGNVR